MLRVKVKLFSKFYNRIILYLWRKGYSFGLHQRIISLLKQQRNLKDTGDKYYIDIGSGDLSFYTKIVTLFKPSCSFS